MKLKFLGVFGFLTIFLLFGLSQVSEAFNYSTSIDIHNETSDLISKEGGGKKGGGKKGGGKKGGGNKGGGKKGGGNKGGVNEKEDKTLETNSDKVQSNIESIRKKAKERFKKWKENKI